MPTATTSSSARAPAAARWPRGWPKRACASCCSRPAAIRAQRARRRSARGLRRAGLPPARLREPGDALGFLRPPLRRRGAAARATRKLAAAQGVLYPRAGTLGGCTAHNAMILISPHDTDWDGIADAHRRPVVARRPTCGATSSGWRTAATGRSGARCAGIGIDPTGHGWAGWLDSEVRMPREALRRRRARAAGDGRLGAFATLAAGASAAQPAHAGLRRRPIRTTGAVAAAAFEGSATRR